MLSRKERQEQKELQMEVEAARVAMNRVIRKRYPEIEDEDLINYLVEIEMADPTFHEAHIMSAEIQIQRVDRLLNKYNKKPQGKKSAKKATKKSGARKVICKTTGKAFDSMKAAAEYYGLKSSTGISKCCKGTQKTSGTYNGQKLEWKFI